MLCCFALEGMLLITLNLLLEVGVRRESVLALTAAEPPF